jgi:hypothetical protein
LEKTKQYCCNNIFEAKTDIYSEQTDITQDVKDNKNLSGYKR